MENLKLVMNRTQFIRFIRTLKEISVNDASRMLSVSTRTIQYYEAGKFPITDKIFDKIIECYSVGELELEFYLRYHAENNK